MADPLLMWWMVGAVVGLAVLAAVGYLYSRHQTRKLADKARQALQLAEQYEKGQDSL